MIAAPLALALAFAASHTSPAPRDERLDVLAAMTAELGRSTDRLKLAAYEAPYFVAYQVKDVTRNEVGGRYGALFDDLQRRDRDFFVDVRVGSYAFDSSGPDDQSILLGPSGTTNSSVVSRLPSSSVSSTL